MIRCQSSAWLLCAITLLSSTWTASAQEWTRFRGPNGSGESEARSVPAKWTDKQVNFNVEVPGIGHSSPVLWGDKLFILSANPDDATRHTLCFDAKTGKKLWQKSFPSQKHQLHKQSSYASSSAAVDDKHVYFAWAAPKSITLTAMTHAGDTVWTRDLGTWSSQHGFGTSPILYKDLVILSNSQESKEGPPPPSFMMAFDRATGANRWKTPRNAVNTSYSVPVIFAPASGAEQLVCTNTGDGMFALDPMSGSPLWSEAFFDKRTVSSPMVKGDLIFGSNGSGGGGNYLVAAQCDGKQPKLAYKIEGQAPYVPTSVVRGDLVFMVSDGGIATCVDLQSGKIHWRERLGGNYSSSLVRAFDKVFCTNADGEVIVLAAEKEFKELGRSTLGDGIRSTPAIANGRIYFRTFSHLISIGGTETASKN